VTATAFVLLSLITGFVLTVREARIAQRRFDDVRKLANSLIFEIHDSIRDLPGSTPALKLLVEKALLYLDGLARESGGDPSLQRELAAAYRRVAAVQGDPYQANLGDTQGALASYRKAAAIFESLAKTNPGSVQDQIGLAGSHRLLAAILSNLGEADALEHAHKAMAISEHLAKSSPSDAVLAELALDYEMLSDIEGDSAGALENLRKELSITELRLKSKPADRLLRRQVAVVQTKMANALAQLGVRKEALHYSISGLETFQSLAVDPTDARAQRQLAFALAKRGEILMMDGDAGNALQCYRRVQGIVELLLAKDPQNAQLRMDLGGTYAKTGTVLAKLGSFSGGLAMLTRAIPALEQDVLRDPSYADVRDTLATARVWMGEVLASMGNLTAALQSYRKGLANFEVLAKVSPKDTNVQTDLAAVHLKVGTVLARMGNTSEASEAYHKSMEIAEPLAVASPPDEQARYTLADAYFAVGDLYRTLASTAKGAEADPIRNWTQARDWYKRSLDAWRRVPNPAAKSPNGFDCGNPTKAVRAIALCDAALAKLRDSRSPME
jgi:non-specific serine/threonine protein kinase/serine/threonine-protein kinase